MKNKLLIYKILLIILIIVAIILASDIIKKQKEDKKYDCENKEIAELFLEEEKKLEKDGEEQEEIMLEYKGYKVVGLLKIPSINLEYPIIDNATEETIRVSISKYGGPQINGYGNVTLAGHNNYSGTMFGKNKNIKLKDKVYLTDTMGKTLEYEVYNIYVTDPTDVSILETKDKDVRELTLMTCKNGRKKRLIIKAREIIN